MRVLQNFINGKWVASTAQESVDVENPATGETLAQTPLSTPAELDAAVRAAAAAFPAWRQTPVTRRVAYLFTLLEVLRREEESLARLICTEMGKSLPDARAEMKRLIENVETACAMPSLMCGRTVVEVAAGIDGMTLRLPLGVFGAICPFNFPGMVPFWFLPYALASGNTYVIKPSERTPLTMERLTRALAESGLPAGVLNLVHGGKEVAEALCAHPVVKGISFVGSTAVARSVAEACARSGKRYQAFGGAKNHLVVMPDAPVGDTARNIVTSAFGCAGQRCMAASVVVCVGAETRRNLLAALSEELRKTIVADPLDPAVEKESVVVGPVISARSKERILALIDAGLKEGAQLALDGRQREVPGRPRGHFIGPTILDHVEPGSTLHRTEIFGPVLCLLEAPSFDAALAIVNGSEYGNGASIYTRSGHFARRFKLEAECGMIGINVGIPAPVAFLPFGGAKASLFADVKAQSYAVVDFFTQEKSVTERFADE
jgi:malonate-semialdehyde dehydrogenase (acetylating) / methylmalonate-semialdehyde dehydrogenase